MTTQLSVTDFVAMCYILYVFTQCVSVSLQLGIAAMLIINNYQSTNTL